MEAARAQRGTSDQVGGGQCAPGAAALGKVNPGWAACPSSATQQESALDQGLRTRPGLGPPGRSPTWPRAGRGAGYLEAAERGVEVVEGQDAVVDRQEAEEPGGTDQEKQQEAAAEAPAVEHRRT